MKQWFKTVAIAAFAALISAVLVVKAAQTNYLGTVFVADSTVPTRQLTVNADGSINTTTTPSPTPAAQTPAACSASTVTTGGTAVAAVAANPHGYVITNPLTATDQGIGAAEALYVNVVTTATTTGNTTTFPLAPGQSWYGVAGQTTATSVNAATNAHKFACAAW